MKPLFSTVLLTLVFTIPAWAADTYKIDPVHSTVLFGAHHFNAGYVWGRFNEPAGEFTLDESDPGKDTFNVEIPVDNVDTHNPKRDAHLKSPDFFNAKQYPTITFKSTAITPSDKDKVLQVAGDLTIHGVTKSITLPVLLTGEGDGPPGTHRAGLEAEFIVKLSDFQIKGLPGAVGDEIRMIVPLEGVKQ
jgi:polyisoprenoid-binding protein YceI